MTFKDKYDIVMNVAKHFGWRFAIKYGFYLKSHQYDKFIAFVSDYMRNYLRDEMTSFNENESIYTSIERKKIENVFVCWWQGYDSMPRLCKACYKQLRSSLSSEYNLILITEENFRDYVNIPEYVLAKLKAGSISITQFSDLLRQGLIAQNGGIWIDSTMWVNSNINKYLAEIKDFWSVKLEKVYNDEVIGQLISQCQWSGFIVGGCKNSPIFKFMFECMCKYFIDHDTPVDYYYQNIIYKVIFEECPYCRRVLDDLAPSNPHLYDLKNDFNLPFDQHTYDMYCDDTAAFKLTYKANYRDFVDGEKTFYKYVMDTLSE